MVCALVADYTYAFKQTFSSGALFIAYLSVLVLRCLLPLSVITKNLCQKVCNRESKAVSKQHYKLGVWLYSALPITYFTGSYRLLNFKNFPGEIGCGLAIDFFLNALPLLFI